MTEAEKLEIINRIDTKLGVPTKRSKPTEWSEFREYLEEQYQSFLKQGNIHRVVVLYVPYELRSGGVVFDPEYIVDETFFEEGEWDVLKKHTGARRAVKFKNRVFLIVF